MEIKIEYIIVAFLFVNFIAILATYIDKKHAKFGIQRVPERVLWFLGAVGGAAGMLMTMHMIHHKTRHKNFMIGLPLLMVAHIIIFVLVRYSPYIVITL